MGQAIAIALCLVPTLLEVIDDRNGETRKDKIRDVLKFGCLYVAVVLVNWWWLETAAVGSLALLLGWRILLFDYLIAAVLIRRGVIDGKWWDYRGKTARFDRLISGVGWRILMAARVVVFAAAIWIYSR